ncbi:MAG: glycerophosphodiester phosphodiesterase [Oscillospiraceae bacterium]|nr:glycerophosphodiester phosphodiesterase [Oscillospiraceae bacterium]
MMIAILILILLALAVRGRSGHKDLPALRKWKYAHRGLHDEKLPENSMAAFRAALEHGYGIELDLHLLADGNLAVMHDSALMRTTGAAGIIEDLTTQELKNYRLNGTEETIPTFQQVLALFDGKAPLIIELKPVKGNHAALTAKAVEMMEGYKGLYCMESFDPRVVHWLRKHRPDICRGQLTENHFATSAKLSAVLKFALTHQLLNFITMPDFVAYKFADRRTPSNFIVRRLWGIQGVTWTLKTMDEYNTAVKEGWIPIFEDFKP